MKEKDDVKKLINYSYRFDRIKNYFEKVIFNSIDFIMKIFFFILKFSLIFVLIYFLYTCKNCNNNSDFFKNIVDTNYLQIICSLLPLIITIVTIAFSLSSEEYYSLKSFTFRKLRKSFTFNFIEMILIVIFILGLCFYSYYCCSYENIFFSFHITIFSLIYSFLFIIQEVPILCKKDKRLIFNLKLNFISKRSIKPKEGLISNYGILNKALTFNILNKGINETYSGLKFHIFRFRNKYIYQQLLISLNDYILEKTELLDQYLKSNSNINDIIEIKDKISFIIQTNSIDFFSENKNKRVLVSLKEINIMGKFVEMLINLQHMCDILKLNTKYNEMLESFMRGLNYHFSDDNNSKIKFSFLNTMIVNTLANEEIWFLEFLLNFNEANFFVNKNNDFLIFLSMYLYYVIKEEEFISEEFNNTLTNFLNKETKIISNYPISFKKIINQLYYNHSLDKTFEMIKTLIKIRDSGIYYIDKFYKKKNKVYKIISFNHEIILNYWMQMVLNKNYSKECQEFLKDKEKFNKILENSNIQDKEFINGMNKSLSQIKCNDEYLKFYNIDTEILEIYSDPLKLYFKSYYDNIVKNKKNKKEFYNKKLFKLLDNSLQNNMEVNFDFLVTKCSSENKETILLEGLIKIDNINLEISNVINIGIFKFKNSFEEVIRKSVNAKTYEKASFEKEIKNYNYINSNNFLIGTKDYDILEKSNILSIDIPFYNDILLWKENGINISASLNSKSLMARRLTFNEINSLIDSRFNVTYGNYLYYSKDISYFLTRPQLYDRISKDFIFISVECEFSYDIDKGSTIIIKK